MSIKNVDINIESPVKFKNVSKTGLIADIVFKESKTAVKGNVSKYSYMIFAFQKVIEKYGINAEMILALLYFKELKVFGYYVRVENKTLLMKDYLMFGLVELEPKQKSNKSYKLTTKANEILSDFAEYVNNGDKHISKNRNDNIELDPESKAKDALSTYFNSGKT